MDDESERKNEIAASLFCILAGLIVLALVTGLVNKAQIEERETASAEAKALREKMSVQQNALEEETERRVALAMEKRKMEASLATVTSRLESTETELSSVRGELSGLRADFDTMAGERDAWKLNYNAERERFAELEKRAKQLESELQASKKSNSELQSKLAKANEEKTGLKAMLATAGKEKENLTKQLAEANQARDDNKKKLTAALITAETTKKALSIGKRDLQAASAARAGLRNQIIGLEGKLEDLGSERLTLTKLVEEKDAEAAARKKELMAISNNSKKKIEVLESEKKTLTLSLGAVKRNVAESGKRLSVLSGDFSKMVNKLGVEKKALSEVTDQLTKENKKLGSDLKASRDEAARLRKELDTLNRKFVIHQYSGNLRPAKGAIGQKIPFLANTPSELDVRLIPLFAGLRRAEGETESLDKRYREIQEQQKASRLMAIPFAPGSRSISAEQQTALEKKLRAAGKQARFLVVGYASGDGDPGQNALLSSKRASGIAEVVAKLQGDGKSVQAVYFGPTNRFSKSNRSPNRSVEVWQVN